MSPYFFSSQLKTKKLGVESESFLESLADKTEGFTGAELENMIMRVSMNKILFLL